MIATALSPTLSAPVLAPTASAGSLTIGDGNAAVGAAATFGGAREALGARPACTPGGRTRWASASLTLSDVLGTALGAGLGGAALVVASESGWSISTGVTIALCVAVGDAIAGRAAPPGNCN